MTTAPVLPRPAALRARTIIERMAGVRVVVAGDLMLDQFIVGNVSRISPEAPVPVVLFERDEYRAGGAANVALNAAALGATVDLIGVVGADAAAARLRDLLQVSGVHVRALITDDGRPTTTKVRVVTARNQQVARIDYELDDEIGADVEAAVCDQIAAAASTAGAVIISDYLKGVVTRRLMANVVALANQQNVPVLVDPKIPHLEYYAGASFVTPNHQEAEVATHLQIRTEADARKAAHVFRQRARCETVLITRGEHGMWLGHEALEGHLPAAAREVSDVTGAGDTVIATLALATAAGADPAEAAQLANEAAGIVVGKFGPASVTPAELLERF